MRETLIDSVQATLTYCDPAGGAPVSYANDPGGKLGRGKGKYEDHRVAIVNGRPLADGFSLEREGFVFVRHCSAVTDFYDDDQVLGVYCPEMEALVRRLTGAADVLIFDHTRRVSEGAPKKDEAVRTPVTRVHNDYTEFSAPERVRNLLPADEAEARLARRFAVIQAWRPINRPIVADPLAICDARTIGTQDLVPTRRLYDERVGEVYHIAYNPDNRWYYFPEMTRDEALVFTCYDSKKDGRARFSAHASFHDPNAPADAGPRESMEIRLLAFFDEDND